MDAVYFSQLLVSKKGPLARVWLAAHWDKKLTKAHIFEISIESSVEGILQPKPWKMALRTTGHLLLGVVRIYSRKAKYLLADCNEAFVKIKMAFRPGMVDLPEGNREASLAAITLPEVFHDFENIGDMTIVDTPNTTLHQCRAEEITIKEDYGPTSFMLEDGFADVEFNDPDMIQNATNIDEGFDDTGLISNEKEVSNDKEMTNSELQHEIQNDVPSEEGQEKTSEVTDGFGPPSVGLPSGPSSPEGSIAPENITDEIAKEIAAVVETQVETQDDGAQNYAQPQLDETIVSEPVASTSANQTTLIQNEAEAFALAPLDTTVYRGTEKARSRRKRKLIVDEVKNISGEEMKNQLSDWRDIITTLDLAPPTKKLMHWKETGGVEKLFALPGHVIQSKTLARLYMRHLTTRAVEDEDTENPFLEFEDLDRTRELERSAKRPRLELDHSNLVPQEEEEEEPVNPLELEGSQSLLELSNVAENILAQKETESLKFPNSEIEDSQMLPIENISEILAIHAEIEAVEKSVAEAHASTMQESHTNDANVENKQNETEAVNNHVIDEDDTDANVTKANTTCEDLFDSIMDKHPITDELPINDEETEKTNQNNLLPLEDDDDVSGPPSVGPHEEQLADETYEQFEERVHSKRAFMMLHVMKRNLDAGYTIPFSAVVRGNKRKQVAQKFYTCLVLKKQQTIEMEQSKAYEEVYIKKGQNYDDMFA